MYTLCCTYEYPTLLASSTFVNKTGLAFSTTFFWKFDWRLIGDVAQTFRTTDSLAKRVPSVYILTPINLAAYAFLDVLQSYGFQSYQFVNVIPFLS